MPPIAATAGRTICAGLESSPSITSRLISRPTRKKKRAMSPSLIHSSSGLSIENSPRLTAARVPSRAS